MLDSNALSALGQLKKSIEDSKDYGEGIVRGTNNRFGFVNLDDGREAFLNPDEMQQVLPGDKVKVLVTENDRKKLDAKLEKLISSSLKEFVARYVIKGKNHFVQADHPQLSRWLFVPPKERKKYQDGDYVNCKVSRHPFGDGKAQVSIIQLIGKPDDIGIERSVVIGKFQFPLDFSEHSKEQTEKLQAQSTGTLETLAKEYTDLRDKHFVTIDATSTKDMDDAVYIEKIVPENDSDNTTCDWNLFVAIADPSAYINSGTALDLEAEERSASAYLLGGTLSMFPTELSHDVFSLLPQQDRPTLVCKMHVQSDGHIASHEFFNARINSKHKLSYNQVSNELLALKEDKACANSVSEDALDSSPKLETEIVEMLQQLQNFSETRFSYRAQHCIAQQDNIDYAYNLNDKGHIESVSVRKPTTAHAIIEEAMLATNCCAGKFLAENSDKLSTIEPLFTTHQGFRPERINEIEQLLKKDFPDVSYENLSTLEGYINLIHTLSKSDEHKIIIPTLRRLLKAAELTSTPNPHFGLGFTHYAMITSPIRRYQDLTNHRAIKSLIQSENNGEQSVEQTSRENTKEKQSLDAQKLQQRIGNIRQASRQLDQWLLCEYLSHHTGENFTAKIAAVSNQGIAVRLSENGAESFIQMKNTKSKPAKYDSIRMTLTYEENTYRVDQELPVKLSRVDLVNRQILLEIIKSETSTGS
ncbi:MAG: VacB/RNase II family 3'-5' exoribonuclease [Cellvibrionaceae bacterium]